MENKNHKITRKQASRLYFLETFSSVGMFLPSVVAKNSLWTGLILAVAWVVFVTFMIQKCSVRISLHEKLEKYKFFAWIYYMRFLVNGIFFYSYIILLVHIFLLPKANLFWIGFPMIGLAVGMNRKGLVGRARTIEGLFWFLLFPILLVMYFGVGSIQWENLVADQTKWGGILPVLCLFYPLELLFFYEGRMQGTKQLYKKHSVALCGICILLVVVTIGNLGLFETGSDPYAVISMAQKIKIPGGILVRFDIFFIAFWILGMFASFSGYLFYGNEILELIVPKVSRNIKWGTYGATFLFSGYMVAYRGMWNQYFYDFTVINAALGFLLPFLLYFIERRKKNV